MENEMENTMETFLLKNSFKKYYCGAARKVYEIQMDSCLYYMDNYIQEELELFQGSAWSIFKVEQDHLVLM